MESQKNTTGALPKAIFAFFAMLLTSAVGALADSGYNGQLLRFDNLTIAIDTIAQISDSYPANTTYLLSIDDDIIGISNFTFDDTVDASKRWDGSNAPLGASWTQHQVAQQGTWWSQWYPASCVYQNGLGGSPFVVTVTQSMSYSASWNAGFDVTFAEGASVNIGYTITEQNTNTQSVAYTVPAYGYGQVWQHQLMVWQDQQSQHCHKYHYGSGGIKCGAWSAYVRGNFPVKNGEIYSWSTGHDNMNFNSCGGA